MKSQNQEQDRRLRFGIPSLDRLFGRSERDRNTAGVQISHDPTNRDSHDVHVSLCITGPSGTGKSLLGLHLASRCWADSRCWMPDSPPPKIIYVSTDLGFDLARKAFSEFGLDKPCDREVPFGETIRDPDKLKTSTVSLTRFEQSNTTELADYLISSPQAGEGSIAFIDLAEATAGDDWGFVTRLISLLPAPGPNQPNHLVVIDAVEGLEMLTGETDSFGQPRSRRSRVAQILRAAAGKCHVALILEEDDAHRHPPEEYVTDVVIRLRVERERDYMRRSIELVKSRGQQLIRGEHHYFIRGKHLDSAGNHIESLYPDLPKSAHAYIQIVRSLHSLSSLILNTDRSIPDKASGSSVVESIEVEKSEKGLACFVTPKFGRILHRFTPDSMGGSYLSGLVRGKVTCLIGDEATMKSRFARSFLAGAFLEFKDEMPDISILLTTFNLSREETMRRLTKHLNIPAEKEEEVIGKMGNRFICRQMEIHHLNSSLFFHMIRRCVEEGLRRLDPAAEEGREWSERSKVAGRLRLVIDDWAVIQSTHPEIAADPLFLPFLIKYLQRVGVTALIVATHPGRPEEILKTSSEQQLRALVDYHLYTWHVPFYGSDRIAITAVPPTERGALPSIGELRDPKVEDGVHEKDCVERVWIDPHFELYQGLEKQDPSPIRLEVRLYSGAPGFEDYLKSIEGLLGRLFAERAEFSVVVPEHESKYGEARDFSLLHGDTKMGHTVVLQVDEYWKETSGTNDFATGYLAQRTTSHNHEGKLVQSKWNDPFQLYLCPKDAQGELPAPKWRFFDVPGYFETNASVAPKELSGVPFIWDCGFMLLRVRAWKGAIKELGGQQKSLVQRVFAQLTGSFGTPESQPAAGSKRKSGSTPTTTWSDFFRACKIVANWHNRPHWDPMMPFNLDMLTPQSFASLVLEIWATELLRSNPDLADVAFPRFRHKADGRGDDDISLIRMLGADSDLGSGAFRHALFKAWSLLAEVIDPAEVTEGFHQLVTREANHNAVAERHWYSTGSLAWRKIGGDNPVVPARLPGCFTTRGDWLLVVAKESRSMQLGARAIDLLCRRRANSERMEAGIGLPTRRLNQESWDDDVTRPEAYREILTGIANYERGGRRRIVRYGDFLSQLTPLGVTQRKKTKSPTNDFRWLWRSRIADYHRHDRLFEKWLGRLMVESSKLTNELRSQIEIESFAVYDFLENHPTLLTGLKNGESDAIHVETVNSDRDSLMRDFVLKAWGKFNVRCDSLVSELKQQQVFSSR